MTSDHLTKEADRLRKDPIFLKALDDIRTEALEALVSADADKYEDIVRLQQRVKVIEEIRATLDRYIIAADVQEPAGSFA